MYSPAGNVLLPASHVGRQSLAKLIEGAGELEREEREKEGEGVEGGKRGETR